jgi:RimJ/RimL family protein N-acetyltransferase
MKAILRTRMQTSEQNRPPRNPVHTEEIVLRQWRDSDLEPYAAMNANPEVMRYFPAPLNRAETAASLQRVRRAIDERGWGLWAVDVDGEFAGFAGLNVPTFSAPFMPCVEIGWRFHRKFWGRSLAYRAARAALSFGFESLKLAEVVSFTAATNLRSRRLMERLGLEHEADGDFDHPSLPEGHALRRHVLYRIGLHGFRAAQPDRHTRILSSQK